MQINRAPAPARSGGGNAARRSLPEGTDDFESFNVKFIGSQKVQRPTGGPVIPQVINQLLMARKKMKIKTASIFELRVHNVGLRLIDKGTTTKTSAKSLQKAASAAHRVGGATSFYSSGSVKAVAYMPGDAMMFGFITHAENNASEFACHVFQHYKTSVPICNAIDRARKDAIDAGNVHGVYAPGAPEAYDPY
jgi:hypothetical protein